MRVLCIHNRYQQRGGEDAVFDAESALLERNSHTAIRLVFDNDTIEARRSAIASARLAADTIWSRSAAARIRAAIRQHQPDIAHFHNTFPLISPAAYCACQRENVPVVQTIHNYRLACPNASFYRDGGPCHDCHDKAVPWPGVLHACYRDSRAQSAVVASMLAVHRLRGTWSKDVDRYVALTEFSRRQLTRAGLPPKRLSVKSNFLDPDPGSGGRHGDHFLFVGRLAENKGIQPLLGAWTGNDDMPLLQIAGDGPLVDACHDAAVGHRSICYLGRLDRPAVLDQMQGARALIFPSLWYESFPVTIIEAFACGLPVIASRLGVLPEIVSEGETGLLFNPGDPVDIA